jgi:hypothetical protein
MRYPFPRRLNPRATTHPGQRLPPSDKSRSPVAPDCAGAPRNYFNLVILSSTCTGHADSGIPASSRPDSGEAEPGGEHGLGRPGQHQPG